jgi:hypothetical protein
MIESCWLYKKRDREQTNTYILAPCLLPCDILHHIGTLPVRRPLPDEAPRPCISRTRDQNQLLFFTRSLSQVIITKKWINAPSQILFTGSPVENKTILVEV